MILSVTMFCNFCCALNDCYLVLLVARCHLDSSGCSDVTPNSNAH